MVGRPPRRQPPALPQLSDRPDAGELALAYASMAAAYHQEWLALIGRIEGLEQTCEGLRRLLDPNGEIEKRFGPNLVKTVLDQRELEERRASAVEATKLRHTIYGGVAVGVILAALAFLGGRLSAPQTVPYQPPAAAHP